MMVDRAEGEVETLILQDPLNLSMAEVGIVFFCFFNGLSFIGGEFPDG